MKWQRFLLSLLQDAKSTFERKNLFDNKNPFYIVTASIRQPQLSFCIDESGTVTDSEKPFLVGSKVMNFSVNSKKR